MNRAKKTIGIRKGVAAVEFALIAPLLLLLVFGIVEFGRAMMIQQVITNATREGARHAIIESATIEEVESIVNQYLGGAAITSATTTITPSNLNQLAAGDPVEVLIVVPYSQNSWISFFDMNIQLSAESTMQAERYD